MSGRFYYYFYFSVSNSMVTVHQPLSLPDLTLHDSSSLDYLIEPVADR